MSTPRIPTGVRRAALAVVAIALIAAGCSEPFTAYHVPGSREYVAEGKKILVMPFMDTRTFIDSDDPRRIDLGSHARSIFVAAMRDYNAGAGASILTPAMPQPVKSLTNAEVADIGRRHGADVVVAGQVFSYTGTRAASIPPRAGMFVRVISAHDGALLFVGDHYQAAAIPGASGGRELQARNVSNRLVEGLLSRARPAAQAMLGVASSTAMAMLSPVPVGQGLPVANSSGRSRTAGAEPRPLPPPGPGIPGLAGGSVLSPDEWDEQIIPEVPPMLDFGEDFYSLAAPASPEPAAPETDGTAEEQAASPEADEENALVDTTPAPLGQDADRTGTADIGGVPDDRAPAQVADSAVTETIDAAAGSTPDAMPDSAEVAGIPAPAVEESPVAAAPATAYAEPRPLQTYSVSHVDSAAAAVIDELPEIDFRDVHPNMVSIDAPLPVAVAAKLSGDELAEDLFADGEDAMGQPSPRPSLPAAANSRRTVVGAAPTPAPASGTGIAAAGAVPPATGPAIDAFAIGGEEIILDPDTLEVVTPPSRRQATPVAATAAPAAPRAAAPVSSAQARPATRPARGSASGSANPSLPATDAGGRIVSVPLAVEQPHTVKALQQDHSEDPDAIRQDGLALVAVPARGTPEGIRVLILPYHDRPNSNNLIANTGGGEVVTTLFGTQLAGDTGITLLWDGSGQATHDRLVSREEAITMGRLADADYVMRGQVVEFRRAQSVPSFYSAVISTAVLAAQVFFAEMSGVDVATEVYRVSDGLCVMSRRDRSQQKYVVQAEKTVRRMAAAMAEGVGAVVREDRPEAMDPLIDELTPVSFLSTPR